LKQYINELKPGDKVESVFALAKKQLIPFKDPSKGKFMSLTLGDKTGQIDAKLWDGAEEAAAAITEESLVKVAGLVSEYRGNCQITVENITKAEIGKWKPEDFLPSGMEREVLLEELRKVVASLDNAHLKELLSKWFSEKQFLQAYLNCPAAKRVHHACIGGLAEHSLEICSYAEQVAKHYPKLNRDLIITGALLHDVGKLKEYRYETAIKVTDEGRLFGHSILGWDMIAARIALQPEFPSVLADHLKHIIFTHHGELEWGSTVYPQTPEAMVVFYCDLLSGRVRQVFDLLQQDSQEEIWTNYDRLLSRAIYKGFQETEG